MPKNRLNKPLYPPKDHRNWAKLKSRVHNNISRYTPYKEGEIYWFYFGDNIGVEEDGKNEYYSRPAVIVRGFSEALIWVVPLSRTKRTGQYYYVFQYCNRSGKNVLSKALLSQMRPFDAGRISGGTIGKVDLETLIELKQRLAEIVLEVRNYPR